VRAPFQTARMRGLQLLVAVVVVAAVSACAGAPGPSLVLPRDFPRDFPVPADAQNIGAGDALHVRVPRSPSVIVAFYQQALPETGWTITSSWDGKDPHGRPSAGFTVIRDDREGAIAISAVDDGTSAVQVNFRHPRATDRAPMGPPGTP
jgi:hypothetical protein